MADPKPWEMYDAPEAPKPWEEHGTTIPDDQIIQEMHPDLSIGHRLAVKNFSNSPENSAEYLRGVYSGGEKDNNKPPMEVVNKGSQILMRRKGEDKYHVLDPETGFHPIDNPKEALADIGDSGYDLASGIGTTAASGMAGVAGGALTGGPGAIPAAMAAGGATGATLEYLRQKLGEKLGINKNGVDSTDVAINTVTGALSPLLFGTGATAGQLARASLKGGLTKEAAKDLAVSQRGLGGIAAHKVYDDVLPAVGEAASGVHRQIIKSARDYLPEMLKLNDTGVANMLGKARSAVTEGVQAGKNLYGNIAAGLRGDAPGSVSLENVTAPIENYIQKLESKETKTAADVEAIDQAKKFLQDHFIPADTEATPTLYNASGEAIEKAAPEPLKSIDPVGAATLKARLLEASKGDKAVEGTKSVVANSKPSDKEFLLALGDASKNLSNNMEQAVPGLSAANQKYGEYAELGRQLENATKSNQGMENTLNGMYGPGKRSTLEMVKGADALLPDANLQHTSDLLHGSAAFIKPSLISRTIGGNSPTPKTIGAAALGSGLGYAVGQNVGEGHRGGVAGMIAGGALGAVAGGPAAMRFYINNGRAARSVVSPLVNSGAINAAINSRIGSVQKPLRNAWDMMSTTNDNGR